MPPLRNVSGEMLLKVLCNKYGFKRLRQSGSHVIIEKIQGIERFGTVVPMHKELKIGTLKGIIKQARLNWEDVAQYI